MVPKNENGLESLYAAIEGQQMPSLTYRIFWEKQEVCGQVEGLDALKQALEKRISTEKYRYDIYDGTYGLETADLLGKNKDEVIPKLQIRLEEALLADERVKAVFDMTVQTEKNNLILSCHVESIYGVLSIERTVEGIV